jgi:hypothetical protein
MIRFFAVPDPDDPPRMTFWQRHEAGILTPWPKNAHYGPRAPFPTGRSVREQLRAARWAAEHYRPWLSRIEAAIEADPTTAAARFVRVEVRCALCRRKLKTVRSREYGIGPECLGQLPAEQIEQLHAAVLRAGTS